MVVVVVVVVVSFQFRSAHLPMPNVYVYVTCMRPYSLGKMAYTKSRVRLGVIYEENDSMLLAETETET